MPRRLASISRGRSARSSRRSPGRSTFRRSRCRGAPRSSDVRSRVDASDERSRLPKHATGALRLAARRRSYGSWRVEQMNRPGRRLGRRDADMVSHNAHPAAPTGPIERLERAATLLLAASALAAVALVGWGGLVLDPGPLGSIVVALVRAASSGGAVWRAVGDAAVGLRWQDLGLLLGTIVSLLFWWHAVSLVAEVLLLLAASLGWLWCTSLRPLWLILDLLNSAPLAAPKAWSWQRRWPARCSCGAQVRGWRRRRRRNRR